jgi:hypothetical protein
MTKRVLLAGLLGGIAMFAWTSIAHMVLPLGDAGIKEMPNESAVLTVMSSQMGSAPGFYFFPGMGVGPNATRAQKKAAMKDYQGKLDVNPSGILLYHPPGVKMMTGAMLGTEFLTELVEAFLVVFLLAQTRLRSLGARVGFVTLAGVLAAIATNISYWNWYGFPGKYTAAYILTQVLGFFCIGIIAALMMKGAANRTMDATA